MSVSIHIRNVVKKFDQNVIIPNLSIDIENGELFTLLGPSGCGKTTLLRMIAGFSSIDGGTISFDHTVINAIPAHLRNTGMVFQNYAIFPHMTVRANVAYGLKLRTLSQEVMDQRLDDILRTVRMDQYADCLPERLSGGQQQRVALARAIVIHPNVLLMDEPLSNLDAKLRVEMRGAIREIQAEAGITTVYVTHDQEEALCISDRIAVMCEGQLQQVGTPRSLYTRPHTLFVAAFIGHSNLFAAKRAGQEVVFCEGYRVHMGGQVDAAGPVCDADDCLVGVRPEEFRLAAADEPALEARVLKTIFLGRCVNYQLAFSHAALLPNQPSIEFSQDSGTAQQIFQPGDTIRLTANPQTINIFSKEGISLMRR